MCNLDLVKAEVAAIRKAGYPVSDVTVQNQIATYMVEPGRDTGYIQEVHLPSGERRNCGLGSGCFFTDWR